MSIQQVGLKAYSSALQNFTKAQQSAQAGKIQQPKAQTSSFSEMMSKSLEKVNDLQSQKDTAIASFASGENQNVHELMISLQKAGLAMNMTAAVRNKVMEAYKELSRVQF